MSHSPLPNVPAYVLSVLRNLYEIERKLALHGDAGNAGRNVQRIRELFADLELFYEDPLGQSFDETRTDLEATISGPAVADLVVVEVIRPIIRHGTRAHSRVVQKGIVVVRAPAQAGQP
jgi:hypothetical protein